MKTQFVIIALAVLTATITAPASAEIYKCTDNSGQVTFATEAGPGCKLLQGSISEGVVCNQFDLIATLESSMLILSVSTDLPDDTIIMVSVSRAYFETGNGTEYAQDYFSEKSTIGKWRSDHKAYLSNEKWKAALKAHRKKMSRMGIGFNIATISDNITVSVVVPINQRNPRFGKGNVKLSGTKVRDTVIRVVKDEVHIDYPMKAVSLSRSRFSSLDPLSLEVGLTYILSKRTPLMPTHSPNDITVAFKQMKYISKGVGFKVFRIVNKGGNPWYKVIVFNRRKQVIGKGWINSMALLGQKLEVFE